MKIILVLLSAWGKSRVRRSSDIKRETQGDPCVRLSTLHPNTLWLSFLPYFFFLAPTLFFLPSTPTSYPPLSLKLPSNHPLFPLLTPLSSIHSCKKINGKTIPFFFLPFASLPFFLSFPPHVVFHFPTLPSLTSPLPSTFPHLCFFLPLHRLSSSLLSFQHLISHDLILSFPSSAPHLFPPTQCHLHRHHLRRRLTSNNPPRAATYGLQHCKPWLWQLRGVRVSNLVGGVSSRFWINVLIC